MQHKNAYTCRIEKTRRGMIVLIYCRKLQLSLWDIEKFVIIAYAQTDRNGIFLRIRLRMALLITIN